MVLIAFSFHYSYSSSAYVWQLQESPCPNNSGNFDENIITYQIGFVMPTCGGIGLACLSTWTDSLNHILQL